MSLRFGPKSKENWDSRVAELREKKSKFPVSLYRYFENLATFYEHKTYDEKNCLYFCDKIETFDDGSYAEDFYPFLELCKKYYADGEESYRIFQQRMGGYAPSVAECEAVERQSLAKKLELENTRVIHYEDSERKVRHIAEKSLQKLRDDLSRQVSLSNEAVDQILQGKDSILQESKKIRSKKQFLTRTTSKVKSSKDSSEMQVLLSRVDAVVDDLNSTSKRVEQFLKSAEKHFFSLRKYASSAHSKAFESTDAVCLDFLKQVNGFDDFAEKEIDIIRSTAQKALEDCVDSAKTYEQLSTFVKKRMLAEEQERRLAARNRKIGLISNVALHLFSALITFLLFAISYRELFPESGGIICYVLVGIIALCFLGASLNFFGVSLSKYDDDENGNIFILGLVAFVILLLVDFFAVESYWWNFVIDQLELLSLCFVPVMYSFLIMNECKQTAKTRIITLIVFLVIVIGLSALLIS